MNSTATHACLGLALLAACTPGLAADAAAAGRLERDGVAIEFEARPADGRAALREGADADLRFRISDLGSGRPVTGLAPGAWLDLAQGITSQAGMQKDCKDKIALYLKGVVGIRPMVDLNGHFLLLLNQDASITVIDPAVSLAGTTSTYASILLRKPPMDWAASADGKRLYVSMPAADQVAVVDIERFRVIADVPAGRGPVRVALQPDGRYLWVGNDARGQASGVTVIDTQTLKPVLTAATGAGHHEIAFTDDSRLAFVSNRDAGSVTVFDVATLKAVKELRLGSRPLSLAWSATAQVLLVTDGDGAVASVDGRTLEQRQRILLKPGSGPTRFAPDDRHAFVLNTATHEVAVIDAATDELVHTLDVTREPYQIAFTRAFAYVRGLASEKVTLINLSSIGKGRKPIVQGFAAGEHAPKLAGDLPLALGLTPARADAAVYVVSPGNNTAYFYMEGMNAPMAGYTNRGHNARAALVVDRSLREVEPGVFVARVRLPAAGRFDVAFMLDNPRVLHCFAAEVQPDPQLERRHARTRAALSVDPPAVAPGGKVRVRVTLDRGRTPEPHAGVGDVTLRWFRAPAAPRQQTLAREVGAGVYEAELTLPEAGAWYIHVGVPSLRLGFDDQPFTSVRVAGQP